MAVDLPALFGLQRSLQILDLLQQVLEVFFCAVVVVTVNVIRKDALERGGFSEKVGRRLQRAAAFLFQLIVDVGARYTLRHGCDLNHASNKNSHTAK